MENFMVLMPRTEKSIMSTPTLQPRSIVTIGDYPLLKPKDIDDPGTAINSNRFKVNGSRKHNNMVTQFAAKSWQHKAWMTIGRGINWLNDPPFKGNRKASKKVKHMLRIAVALKIRAGDPDNPMKGKSRPVLKQLAPANNPTGMYVIASDENEIVRLFEDMYDMMYNHIDAIVDTIDKLGYGEAVFIMKTIIVYDDKSIDAISGDPRNLFKMLGIEFDKKGRVKL